MRATLSSPAVIRRRPSPRQLAARTPAPCAFSTAISLAGGAVPDARRVIPCCGRQAPSVEAERDGMHRAGVTEQGDDLAAGCVVEDVDLALVGGGHALAVRAEDDGAHG